MADTDTLSDAISTKSIDEPSPTLNTAGTNGGVGETKRQLKPRHLQVLCHSLRSLHSLYAH